MPEDQDPHLLIQQALAGDPARVRALVDRLSPVVSRRVAATLWRANGKRNVSQDTADMVQDVFLALFQNDGKALRAWDPQRGMSLDGFVGLLTQHQVISILRSGRTSPWREELTEVEDFEDLGASTVTPEAVLSSREHLSALLEQLREHLSPRGLELFQRMIVEEESMEDLAVATGMTRDALYQWRSRINRTIRALAAKIDVPLSDNPARARMVKGGPPT